MVANFISLDKRINCGIKCLKTYIFAKVEEKLYKNMKNIEKLIIILLLMDK